MQHKALPFMVKAVDAATGVVQGFAAIIGNEDDGGDVIMPGAFLKTIQERHEASITARGQSRIKMGWQHGLDHPMGVTTSIREVGAADLPPALAAMGAKGGLYVEGKVSLTATNLERLQLIQDGVVDELSIGYDAIQESWTFSQTANGRKNVRQLKELRLYEWSPVTIAMNPLASVTGVKNQEGNAPMELKEVTIQELKATSYDVWGDQLPGLVLHLTKGWDTTGGLVTAADAPPWIRGKAGAVLSKVNREKLSSLRDALDEILKTATREAGDEDEDEKTPPRNDEDEKAAIRLRLAESKALELKARDLEPVS